MEKRLMDGQRPEGGHPWVSSVQTLEARDKSLGLAGALPLLFFTSFWIKTFSFMDHPNQYLHRRKGLPDVPRWP